MIIFVWLAFRDLVLGRSLFRGRRGVRLLSLGLVAFAGAINAVRAEVSLASPFTDHLVLQRELPVPVWGRAEPGERLKVRFDGKTLRTAADAAGAWRVELPAMKASAQGRELVVTGSKTKVPLTLRDVLVGEVWLCSGQSNMDFTVARTEKFYFAGVENEAEEVAAAKHPLIRMFSGEWRKSAVPVERVGGAWQVCTPETAREFSAIGYFFARRLRGELDVPVGIVKLTFGASCAQAWVRREAMAADPRMATELAKFDAELAAYLADTDKRAKYATDLAAWEAASAAAKAKGAKAPRAPRNPDPEQDQHNPTVMFNGMVAPVIPYAIRGVLWYQGESITGPRSLFPVWNELLIRDWRSLWGRELPFYFVQLAAYGGKGDIAGTRAMQAEALRLPATGMAVAIDVGDRTDVHPKNKQAVADRLARLALARTYGRDVVDTGPEPVSARAVNDSAVEVAFKSNAGALRAGGGAPGGFELAGADGKFVAAAGTLAGDTVTLRAEGVAEPRWVRYAWANYPEAANLANAEGLPAAPFRMDVSP